MFLDACTSFLPAVGRRALEVSGILSAGRPSTPFSRRCRPSCRRSRVRDPCERHDFLFKLFCQRSVRRKTRYSVSGLPVPSPADVDPVAPARADAHSFRTYVARLWLPCASPCDRLYALSSLTSTVSRPLSRWWQPPLPTRRLPGKPVRVPASSQRGRTVASDEDVRQLNTSRGATVQCTAHRLTYTARPQPVRVRPPVPSAPVSLVARVCLDGAGTVFELASLVWWWTRSRRCGRPHVPNPSKFLTDVPCEPVVLRGGTCCGAIVPSDRAGSWGAGLRWSRSREGTRTDG